MNSKYIGVDLATEKLDVYGEGGHVALGNDEEGRRKFLALVKKAGPGTVVAYESTGYVSKEFAGLLYDHGIAQVCINARKVHRFAYLQGRLAKNDRLDSMTIREYAEWKQLEPLTTHDKFILELRDKVALRKSLVESRKTLKCARHAYKGGKVGHIDSVLETYDCEIRELEGEIRDFIKAHETYGPLHKALLKEPGIGKVAAMTLIAYLPELGHVGKERIAAIVGVAPMTDESGKHEGNRHIAGGRLPVRNELYMVQIASMRLKNWRLRGFYEKLAVNKPPRVALIACCRRHLVQLNAKVRDWYHNGCNGTLPQVGSGEAAQASPRE